MLFLALSCLQGRPMRTAFDELAGLGGAVQLTPGNYPTPGFDTHVAAAATTATRTHHGFDYGARRREVWDADGACLVTAAESDSIHPPAVGAAADLGAILERPGLPVLETMYPGWLLGTGGELDEAMRAGVPLAVDVSHLHIQRAHGVLGDATWRRLQDYPHVREVHVSANDGSRDAHAAIDDTTFGLAWARARLAAGTPLVLECYMHRMTRDERRRQIDLARTAGGGRW